jgi:RND family efflux transporter MFP subunit
MHLSLPCRFALACCALVAAAHAVAGPELATAPAELRRLPREFRLDGVVEAIHRTTVSAQTSGQVQEIFYDVDEYVEKDAVLLSLKDTEHQARVTQAAAELKDAVARRQEALDEYQRTKELHGKQLVAAQAMDKAEAALKSANAVFEAAQAGLAQAREQLEYTRVRAPYAGLVTERHVQVGESARPGQPLMSGLSLEHLRVLVDAPQSLVPRIRELGQARVQEPGDGWVQAEKITVFPVADEASHTFKVRLYLPPGTRSMFPGMFVKTAFVTGLKQELVIPGDAVVYRSEVTGVYVVEADGTLRFRHVRLGRTTPEGDVLVLAGLTPGERVALDPIAAGAELKRRRAEGIDG